MPLALLVLSRRGSPQPNGRMKVKRELIHRLHGSFEQLVHVEQQTGVEFWLARDLQGVLGYDRWENFERVVGRAITACETSGYEREGSFS